MKYILSLIFIINTSLNVIEKKYWVCHVNVDYPDIDLCYVRLIEADSEVKAKRMFNDQVLQHRRDGKWKFTTYFVTQSTYWINHK